MLIAGITVSIPHTCATCHEHIQPDGRNFRTKRTKDGKRYKRLCRICDKIRSAKLCEESRLGTTKFIIRQARNFDQSNGFQQHELDYDVVNKYLNQGCRWCGAKRGEWRIGLDRIDNSTGHSLANVVPCCTRCNIMKGSMPIGAWRFLAPWVRFAFILGKFGDWMPGNRKRASLPYVNLNPRTQMPQYALVC